MRLVDDDRVVITQQPVALRFREQDAVGHYLEVGVGRDLVGEAHLVAHRLAHLRLQLRCDASGDRARRDAPRLRVPDHAGNAASQLEANFRQLRRFARPRLAADDHHRVVRDRARDLLPPRDDGQILGVSRPRQVCAALLDIKLQNLEASTQRRHKGKLIENGNLNSPDTKAKDTKKYKN